MDWDKFSKLQEIFSRCNVSPIIGVVPENKDEKLKVCPESPLFWQKIKELAQLGWVIAQHGYQHTYVTSSGGILGFSDKSEFAGLSYEQQLEKIQKGKEILQRNLAMQIDWWMAPSHSFDKNTCRALQASGFRYITDGIALFPFKKYGLTWLPQQLWRPRNKLFGVWTICIHPNTVTEDYLKQLENFLVKNNKHCIHPTNVRVYASPINAVYALWWKFQYFIYKHFLS